MRSDVAIGMLAVASWGASMSEAVSAHPGGLAAVALTLCPPGPRDNCVVDGDTF